MRIDNPLTIEFISRYPVDSARVLEQISSDNVAALFSELSVEVATPILTAMLPNIAAACLVRMDVTLAVKLLSGILASNAARIYRLLGTKKQEELSAQMPDKIRSSIFRHLDYAAVSAGDLMDSAVSMLPAELTVADAIRRIERLHHTVTCEIYVIDNTHHLLGIVELGSLLTANHHVRLQDIMNRKTQSIYAFTTAEILLSHPGWAMHRRLPVVERDNTLVGVLDYNRLQDSVAVTDFDNSRDPLDNLFSLAGLYWLSVAQLLDSILSIARSDKGRQQ